MSAPGASISDPPHPDWTYGKAVDTYNDGAEWVAAGETAGWTVVDAEKEDPA